MEHKDWGYDDFPEYAESVEGAVRICTTGDEIGVHYLHHIEYATVNGTALHMELLIPFTRNERMRGMVRKYACVVFIQGSAWMEQDVFGQIPDIAKLAQRGYVVAVAEYRHSGLAVFPAQAADARNAIRFLKKNAEQFQIDSDKMFLAGDSSGGHTAMFGVILQDDDSPENLFPGFNADVKGIMNYYGSCSVMREDANPTTMNYRLPDSPEGMVMGGADLRKNPKLREKLSVECNITESTEFPPVIMFHGTKDRMVNIQGSVDLYRQLKKCGKDVQFYLIEGGDHGGGEYWMPQIIDIVEGFIQNCLTSGFRFERKGE